MREILIIAHERDVDGLGCHGIMRRYASLNHLSIEHFFTDYANMTKVLRSVSGATEKEIIIADLGYSDALLEILGELKKISQSNRVRWFDHHDWKGAGELLSLPIEFNIDQTLCASELVQRSYLPRDEVAIKIASLAHNTDYMLKDGLAWKFYDLISSGCDKLELVKSLAKGDFWNDAFEMRYQDYQKTKAKAFASLEERSRDYKVAGLKVTLGFSGKELSSTLAANHLLKNKGDITVCLWKNGKLSFRRNNDRIDLGKLARHFKGGGHAYAAGGFYPSPVDESNYVKAFEGIVKKLEALL
jgi:oligoribonuclease NrnB/cAMP/cGMP phosphodiesterase (DHH superfamily)